MSSPSTTTTPTDLKTLFSLLNPAPAWKREFADYSQDKFLKDLMAGVTVAIVALPLALAFGVVSGAGAAAGVITAIVAGIVAAVFGGSRYQVTGPTGAMTVVLLPIISQYGMNQVYVIGIMAGIMLVAIGLARLGRIIDRIPWPVITGFTNGIAIIIGLQQVPGALGLKAHGGETILPTTLEALRRFAESPNWTPLLLTLASFAIMLLWPKVTTRVPAGIIALLVVTGVATALHLDVPRISDIPKGLPLPHLPQFNLSEMPNLFGPALSVAMLAGIESLLSAIVADGMARVRDYKPNRELVGQGLANIISPLFGGIPSTGAIARTAVGVKSGTQTRMTAIIHSVVLLVVVLALGNYAALVPLSVLSGILLNTAYRMFETEAVRALRRSTKSDFATMLATMAVTVIFDLILAIEIGLLFAGLLFIQRLVHTPTLKELEIDKNAPPEANVELLTRRVLAFRVDGPLFFAVSGRMLENLTSQKEVDVIILRMQRATSLDASGAHALEAIFDDLNDRHIKLLFSGIQEQPKGLIQRMGLYDKLTTHGEHDFTTTTEAIAHAWSHVDRRTKGHAWPA